MKINKLLKSLLFYGLVALGISLTIKAEIGVSSFNSLNLSLASLSGVKVGTITTLINGLFLLAYMGLTKFKHLQKYLLQLVSIVCFGFVINFFTYTILANLSIRAYPLSILLFVFGVTLSGFGTGMILYYDVLSFPIESVCHWFANATAIKFSTYRYCVDLVSITGSLAISYLYKGPIFVREGTLISFVLLSLVISTTFKLAEKKSHS